VPTNESPRTSTPPASPETAPVRTSVPPKSGALFGVEPEEQSRTAVLAGMLFVCSCVFVLGRTVRDALFLSHYGARVGAVLPWMFIAYGVVSAMVAVVYARVAPRFSRPRFVASFAVLVAAMYGSAWVALFASPSWLYGVLYVASEIAGNLLIAQFWAVANDLHDPRSAKRLFGTIGVGRILGVVICGLGAGSFVAAVGTDNLLLVLAVLSLSIVGFVLWLARDFNLPSAPPALSSRAQPAEGMLTQLRSPYIRSVALVVLVGFVAVNIGDFQFKAAARLAHPSRDELALFMARYYATVGVIAMLLQLFVTRRLLSRFGVGGGLLALPIAYGTANLVLLAIPSVFGATVVKLSDNAVQFTVFEATLQLLYFPLDSSERDGARATLEAAVKPIGYAIAGGLVLGFAWIAPPTSMRAIASQSWFVLPLIGAWFLAVRVVRRRYVAALERSLERRTQRSSEPVTDEASTREALVRTARSGAPRAACFAIEQLTSSAPETAAAEAAHWLTNPEASVRIAAVKSAAELRAEALSPLLLRAMDDPDVVVAASAVTAYGVWHGERCITAIEARLTDPRSAVEEAAIVALLQHGALEGVLIAGRTLEEWLRSTEVEDRRRAARVLGTQGVPGALRVVRALLEDDDVEVRRAALRAAAASGIALAPEVIRSMDEPATRAAAMEAIVRMGEPAVPLLAARLSDRGCPRAVRLSVPRVLAQIGTSAAYELLLARIDITQEPDEAVRQKILASASRMRRSLGLRPLAERQAEIKMSAELDALARQSAAYRRARSWLGMILLDRWMLERFRKALLRVLRLAELSPDGGRRVEPTREALFGRDSQRRARALEVLDDVLPSPVAPRFNRELEQWLSMRDHPAREPEGPRPSGMTAYVTELYSMSDPFAKVLALDAAQFRAIDLGQSLIASALEHEDPSVREFGALAEVSFKSDQWRERVEKLAEDEDRSVRSYVKFVLETGQTGMSREDDMFTTLEKVLFLQRVELFSEVAPEDLMGLARSARVDRHKKGTVLFRAGDPGSALYLVIDGRVRTTTATGITTQYSDGEAFGELGALDGSVRSDEADVVEDATLIEIAREDFVEVLRENGPLAEAVIRVLVRRMRSLRGGEASQA
jgi:ATP/ADP translocase/HEAT repeat protein